MLSIITSHFVHTDIWIYFVHGIYFCSNRSSPRLYFITRRPEDSKWWVQPCQKKITALLEESGFPESFAPAVCRARPARQSSYHAAGLYPVLTRRCHSIETKHAARKNRCIILLSRWITDWSRPDPNRSMRIFSNKNHQTVTINLFIFVYLPERESQTQSDEPIYLTIRSAHGKFRLSWIIHTFFCLSHRNILSAWILFRANLSLRTKSIPSNLSITPMFLKSSFKCHQHFSDSAWQTSNTMFTYY